MTRWLSVLGVGLLCTWSTPAAQAADDATVPSSRLCSFADAEVVESSGLVDRGRILYTTNDSGGDAVLYGIDPGSGRTLARTTYADEVEDVEALAPGRGGTVWAGDIGDNRQSREGVAAYRVTPGADEDAPRYDLTYPDGPRDAETLLARPGTDRLFVVSKSVFGGTVFAAPRHPRTDRPNRLRPFARVSGLVTDGAFLPDGRRVVLRTYGTASVYTFPSFELVGTVRLPAQRQGEAISVSADRRVLLSSEGAYTDVLRVRLPSALTSPARPSTRTSPPPPGPAPSTPAPSPQAQPGPPARDAADWVLVGGAALVLVGLGWLAARLVRVRPRRR